MMAEMLLIAGKKGRTMFQSLRGGYTHVTYSSILYLYYEVIIARNDFFLQIPGIKTHPCQPTVWCGWVHPPTSRPQVLVLECEPRRRLLKKNHALIATRSSELQEEFKEYKRAGHEDRRLLCYKWTKIQRRSVEGAAPRLRAEMKTSKELLQPQNDPKTMPMIPK